VDRSHVSFAPGHRTHMIEVDDDLARSTTSTFQERLKQHLCQHLGKP
jgi:hypothetical protein